MKINAFKRGMPRIWPSPKILLVVKITTFFLLVTFMAASAATYAQKVTLTEKNASLEKVLNKIRKQTGYDFVYDAKLLKNAKPVTINVTNVSIDEALKDCFTDQGLSYDLEDKTILIIEKKPSTVGNIKAVIAKIDVHGRIVDENGQPLVGATIMIIVKTEPKDQKQGKTEPEQSQGTTGASPADMAFLVASDAKGEFFIPNVDENASIKISYVGYKDYVNKVSKDIGTIKMVRASKDLNEVTVSTGYQTKPLREMTGSAASISGNDLKEGVTSSDAADMLKGRLAGIYVTSSGGDPNNSANVVQRGYSDLPTKATPNSSSSPNNSFPTSDGDGSVNYGPLIVVDGVITNARNITDVVSVADIESVTQLKDASATAIYGSKAAQGVIVITTRKGSKGKPVVAFDVSTGISTLPQGPYKLLSTSQYVDLMTSALTSTYQLEQASLAPQYPTAGSYIAASLPLTPEQLNTNTNWWPLSFKNGQIYSSDVSVSGGDDKIKYYVGASYYKDNGNQVNTEMERKSFRVNLDINLSKRLSMNVALSTIWQSGVQPNVNFTPDQLPFLNPYNKDGSPVSSFTFGTLAGFPSTIANPIFDSQYSNITNDHKTYQAATTLKYRPVDWLTLSSTNSFIPTYVNTNNFVDPSSFAGAQVSPVYPGTLQVTSVASTRFLTSNLAQADKYFGDNHFTALIGEEYYRDDVNTTTGFGYGMEPGSRYLSSAQFFGSPLNPAAPPISEYPYSRAGFSAFSEADYAYKQKYLATATLRTDASSNFGIYNRYGTFYSVAGGWVLTKEDFLKDNSVLTNLKLRGSYGTTGKEAGADYLNDTFYQLVQKGYNNNSSSYPLQLGNPNITWETTNTLNLGLDATFFNRVSISVDNYNRQTKNLIELVPVGSYNGIESQYRNVGAVSNKGVEITLNSTNVKGKDFTWKTNFNITFNKNRITQIYGGSLPVVNADGTSNYSLNVGDDVGTIKAIKYLGVNAQTGQPIFEGMGNNGKLFTANSYYAVQAEASNPYIPIGSTNPKYFGGFSNLFSYKNFSLNIITSFAYGMLEYNPTKYSDLFPSLFSTSNYFQLPAGASIWQKPGNKATLPVVDLLNDAGLGQIGSSYVYDDASHLRIESARLGYSLNEKQAAKLGLSRATLFISVDNAYVFKKASFFGNDPEGVNLNTPNNTGQGIAGSYGQPRTFILGIQTTF
jgi:TonB-linked SusC/RagA family outer membrane protein